jgi:hypothetical protein
VGFQSDLAANYATLADLLISSGHREEGIAFLRKARASWNRLARDHPTVPENRADLARACEDLAAYLPDPPVRKRQIPSTGAGAIRVVIPTCLNTD